MKQEQYPEIQGSGAAHLNARARGLSPNKRALLERLLTSRKSDLPAAAKSRNKRLVAYVVPRKNHSLTSTELRNFLRERLPEYMVPGAILELEEMPLTASGKIDRKRLLTLKGAGRQLEREYAGARTPIEEIVAGVFEEVLNLDRVGRSDNFFEIGGHSLLATQVVSRVRNAFGVEIEVRSIFEDPTVEGLAIRIVEAMRGGDEEERLHYWKNQLGGKPPVINLAGDHRPQIPSYRRAAKSIPLPAELCESLKTLSKREGVTLFMALLAAFKTLLSRYTAETDIVVGAAAVNGDQAGIDHPAGSFIHMLPMRTDLSGNPRFTQLVKKVKDVALGAYAHQEAPFEKSVEEIQPERGFLGQTPLFNIAFGIRNAPEEEARLTKGENDSAGVGQYSTRLDLTLWITKGAEAIQAEWIYNADLFEEVIIKLMHSHFETLLSSIVARPDTPLDELEMLSEAEKAQQAINRAIREEYNYSRFKSVKPRAVVLSED